MPKGNGHSIYEFDEFRLDASNLMLYRGEAEISLPPKVIKTLAVLVENRGELISKEELIDKVWEDSIVEESNLSQYLYLLRKTLGSKADGSPYIETLRRRGYRFTGQSTLLESSPASNGNNKKEEAPKVPRYGVERRGNVLALVDWKAEGEQQEAEKTPNTAEAVKSSTASVSKGVLALAGVILLLSAFSVILWFNSGSVEQVESNGELNVLRLTNGIEVVDATISPDGKYFVYHEPDGKLYRMWLQQTGQATRHEIVPASERLPLTKTFTPDGRYIYFLAADAVGELGTLYRVATLGGPVTKIMSEMHTGVSFSPDGGEMVYYRPDKDGANYVIKASDGSGDERVLYRTTPGFGWAAWSPDSRSIAIVLQAKREDIGGGCYIAVVNQDTGQPTNFSSEVWAECGRLEWAPDGRGLYMIATRQGDAMTTRRNQVFYISYPQGKSRKITAEGNRHQWGSLSVSRDGSVLVVPFNRSSQIWAMDPNGESRSARQITTGQNDGRSGIAPLADGRVAYISRTAENLNVWVVNQDGSDQKQITDSTQAIEELRSGGDGRYLVFSGYSDPPRSHLFRINTDGTGLLQITSGEGQEIDSSLSNDSKWIVYASTISAPNKFELSLWKQSIDGGERVSLNRHDCKMPHFSPNDRYISCVRDQKDILILSSANGALVQTLRTPPAVAVYNSLNFGARWTPDGKAVAYIVNDKGVSNIWSHPIDGDTPKRLTDFTGGSIYHFAYSHDGSRLFVARGHQIRDAVLISITN